MHHAGSLGVWNRLKMGEKAWLHTLLYIVRSIGEWYMRIHQVLDSMRGAVGRL
jgi:hypothetical protein